jgi:hypothetical protein
MCFHEWHLYLYCSAGYDGAAIAVADTYAKRFSLHFFFHHLTSLFFFESVESCWPILAACNYDVMCPNFLQARMAEMAQLSLHKQQELLFINELTRTESLARQSVSFCLLPECNFVGLF